MNAIAVLLLAAAVSAETFRYVSLQELLQRAGAAVPAGLRGVPPALRVPPSPRPEPARARYQADLARSSARMRAEWKLGTAEGHFEKFEVEAWIDEADLTRSTLKVKLDTTSAVSDKWYLSNDRLRAKLRSKDYPTSTLITKSVTRASGRDVYILESELTIMGVAYPKMINAVIKRDGARYRASGSFSMTIDGETGTMTFDLVIVPAKR